MSNRRSNQASTEELYQPVRPFNSVRLWGFVSVDEAVQAEIPDCLNLDESPDGSSQTAACIREYLFLDEDAIYAFIEGGKLDFQEFFHLNRRV